jgi:hypothetical protein
MTLMSIPEEGFRSPQCSALLSQSPLPSTDGDDDADSVIDQLEAQQRHPTAWIIASLQCLCCLLGVLIGGIALAALVVTVPRSLSLLTGSSPHYSSFNEFTVSSAHYSAVNESAACLPCECPCSSGPYIYQRGCPLYGEGIGSKLQWLKLSMTVAAMTGFTFIAERGCFTESHNQWDLSGYGYTERQTAIPAVCAQQTSARWHPTAGLPTAGRSPCSTRLSAPPSRRPSQRS